VAGSALRWLGAGSQAPQPLSLRSLTEVLRNRRIRPLCICSLVAFPSVFTLQTVLGKKFLQDFGGLSSSGAAACVLAMTITSVCSVALGGSLPRLFDERRRPPIRGGAILFALTVCLLLAAVLSDAPGWVFPVGYVMLAVTGLSMPSSTSAMRELSRPGTVAMCIAVINGLSYVACGTVGQVGGLILDQFRDAARKTVSGTVIYPKEAYAAFFAFLSVLAVVNLLSAWQVPETRGIQQFREQDT